MGNGFFGDFSPAPRVPHSFGEKRMGEALRVPVIWQCHLMKGGNRCLYSVTPFSEMAEAIASLLCELAAPQCGLACPLTSPANRCFIGGMQE